MGHALARQGTVGQEGRAFERATGRIVLVEVRKAGAAVEPANGHIVRLLEPLRGSGAG